MFSIRELRRRLQQGNTAKPEVQPEVLPSEAEKPSEPSVIDDEEALRRDRWFWATLQTLSDIIHG